MIAVKVKFFGAFRKFGEGLDLSVPPGSTVKAIKKVLQDRLEGYALVADSVLADEKSILRDSDILESDSDLSILPPVCGG